MSVKEDSTYFPENRLSQFLRENFSGGCFGCIYCNGEICNNSDLSNINYNRKVSNTMICQFYTQ